MRTPILNSKLLPHASTPAERPEGPERAAHRLGLVLLVVGLVVSAGLRWADPPYDGPATRLDPGFRVAVNQADADTLRLLHGVGPALADNIVAHRNRHGWFKEPADLEAVHRIGPSTRARIERWVRFD